MELEPENYRKTLKLIVYFLDGGIAELENVATIMIQNSESIYRLGGLGGQEDRDGQIGISTGAVLEITEKYVNAVNLCDSSDSKAKKRFGRLPRNLSKIGQDDK